MPVNSVKPRYAHYCIACSSLQIQHSSSRMLCGFIRSACSGSVFCHIGGENFCSFYHKQIGLNVDTKKKDMDDLKLYKTGHILPGRIK